jgi:hypothetical protein
MLGWCAFLERSDFDALARRLGIGARTHEGPVWKGELT